MDTNRPQIYDAIVVGTGISTGWTAKEVYKKGLRPTFPERGRMTELIKGCPSGLHGGAGMGHYLKITVINANNQLHDVPKLYITKGAFMAPSNIATPYLTNMSFTGRAAEHAADQLRKGIFS